MCCYFIKNWPNIVDIISFTTRFYREAIFFRMESKLIQKQINLMQVSVHILVCIFGFSILMKILKPVFKNISKIQFFINFGYSATEADDIVEVTTEGVDYVTENSVVDASPSVLSQEIDAVVEKKIFNPVDAWKELGFLEFPVEDIVPANISEVASASPAPVVEIPSGNITRGNIGRAKCRKNLSTLSIF